MTSKSYAVSDFIAASGFIAASVFSTAALAAEQLETVIVTASKVKENIQQTALSVQSLPADALANAGVNNVAEVAKFIPGLQLEQNGGGLTATVRIRGIGTPGFSSLDPSIPIFVDGVAQPHTGSGFQDLLDISRIEILRGPQSTLYGRNSTAGAINVWTKDVNTQKTEGSLLTQLGNYNDKELKGTFNVPIVDGLLGARVSAYQIKQDGYVTNAVTDKTGNGYADCFGGRAKIGITPSDDVRMQWLVEYSNSVGHPGDALIIAPSAITNYVNSSGGIVSLNGSHTLPRDDAYNGKIHNNVDQWTRDTNFATSFTADWNIQEGLLAEHALTSITAYELYKTKMILEDDHTVLDWSNTDSVSATNSWSEEFRLARESENFKYVLGFYYEADRIKTTNIVDSYRIDRIASSTPPPPNAVTANTPDDAFNSDDLALFGQYTYQFTSKFSVTAGLRESWSQRRGASRLQVSRGLGAPTIFASDLVDHVTLIDVDTSSTLKARYFLDEDVMLYATYDRGFKPGGFTRIVVPTPSAPDHYDSETSNNYEVGAKTQWFEHRLQANIAAFYMQFNHYQNQYYDQNQSLFVENLRKVTSDGVELDVQAIAAPGLSIGAGAAYYNPRVRSHDSTVYQAGERLKDASEYTANFNIEYSRRITGTSWQGFARADSLYRSDYGLGDAPTDYKQGGYSLMNFRVGMRDDEGWQLTAWVKNIFNKEYAIYGKTHFGSQPDGLWISQGAPRTYGLTLQYDFR